MIHKKAYVLYIVLTIFFIAACDNPKSEKKSRTDGSGGTAGTYKTATTNP